MHNVKSVKTVCMWNERKNIKHPIFHPHTKKPNTRNVIELAESVSDKALGNPSDQGGAETDENWYYDCTTNPGIHSVLLYSSCVNFSQNQVSFTICPQGNIVNWWCCNNIWKKVENVLSTYFRRYISLWTYYANNYMQNSKLNDGTIISPSTHGIVRMKPTLGGK